MAIKIINGRIVFEPTSPVAKAAVQSTKNIGNFVSGLFGGQGTTSNVDAVTGAAPVPTQTQVMGANSSAAISGLQNKLINNSMQNQLSGGFTSPTGSKVVPPVVPPAVVPPAVVPPASTGSSTSSVPTPRFNPTASTTDWTAKLAGVTASGKTLNEQTLGKLKENINTQYTEQLKAIQTQARQGQLAEQQARQQIAEATFTRERQLLEAASQRGLGGSGLEQLSQVQQRAVVGQQINQLAQQTGLQREQLTNALSQAAAAKNAALNQAEINALTTQLQIDQADLEQGLSLDDRTRLQAYQKFQADLASAEFTNQTEYIQWQKDNAKEQAKLLGVRNKQDALAVLADPNASEDFKKAWIKLNLDAGFITEQEATAWGTQNLTSVNPEELIDTEDDYTSVLGSEAIKLKLEKGNFTGLFGEQYLAGVDSKDLKEKALNAGYSIKNPDGTILALTGKQITDKTNSKSPIYAFKDLPGYAQITPEIENNKIVFTYKGKTYNTFAKASERFQIESQLMG
jgi:DNA-binding phage protein